MKTSTLKLSNENVTLTTYILESSQEMTNTHVRPAILILPGGGYRGCSDREAEPVAMAYLAEGYQAFVLKYSVNEHAQFPRPLNDAEEALELIRSNSQEWGIDPEKVAVCGFSAGGHLAAALSTMGRIKPNAMILGYPVILASMSRISIAPIPGVDEHVDPSTPPAFIFHTVGDTLVPVENALAFASALDRAKVPFEMHIFQNGVHGLSLAKPVTSSGLQKFVDQDAAHWFQLSIGWLKNVFGDFAVSEQDYILKENINEYNVDVQLGGLWKNPDCKKVILTKLPILADFPQIQDFMGVSLRTIVEYSEGLLSKEGLDELNENLKKIPVTN